MCIHDFEGLWVVTISDRRRLEYKNGCTAESTSYTRKPEFRLVMGVRDGPIYKVPHKFQAITLRK